MATHGLMRVALRQGECSFRFGGYLTNVLPIANFKGVAQQSIVQFHLTKGQVVKSRFFAYYPFWRVCKSYRVMTGRIATQISSCTSRNFPGLNHFEGLCQNSQNQVASVFATFHLAIQMETLLHYIALVADRPRTNLL